MRFYLALILGIVFVLFSGCNGRQSATKNFALSVSGNGKTLHLSDTVAISIKNKTGHRIDSVIIALAGQKRPFLNNSIILKDVKPGKQTLHATVYYGGLSETLETTLTILSDISPKRYTYEIVNTYPHDSNAYTQGLEFYRDTLYESTGQRGRSTLRKTDYRTGKVLKKIDLKPAYFGEGITILNDSLYMLTWQSKKGFVYDVNSLELLSAFVYGESKEGWGLCNDGKKLYKSDGTEKIWILDPETLTEEAYIQTVTNTSLFTKTNELEYANGKIYANSYQKDGVMIINPENGIIEGVVDFRGLKDRLSPHAQPDVFNGITYNPATGTFFVTGKNWDTLFEVKIIERE